MTVPGAGKLGTFSLDKVWQYPRLHLAATTQRPERTLQVGCLSEGFQQAAKRIEPSELEKKLS
jgi:hypothetical protein